MRIKSPKKLACEAAPTADDLKQSSMFTRFRKQKKGNVAALYGLTLPLFLFFAGGAIDFTRLNSIRSDMLEACDASALAVARYNDSPEIKAMSDGQREAALQQYGKDFFLDNFAHQAQVKNLDPKFNIDEQTVVPDVEGNLDTIILGTAWRVFGKRPDHSFKVACNNEITLEGTGRVELALVVDVSGSMNNFAGSKRKIDSLRDATDKLMDVLFGTKSSSDNVKIGVVPFNHFVNAAGNNQWQAEWSDTTAAAEYHGDRFFFVDENGVIDVDTPVNHFHLFNSVGNQGAEWLGCVEARPYPLDEIDVPAGSAIPFSILQQRMDAPPELQGSALDQYEARMKSAFDTAPGFVLTAAQLTDNANTRWVPFFHPDEPDCQQSSGGNCQTSGSVDVELEVGSFARDFDANYFWFDNPAGRGWTNNDYINRDFIDDKFYTESFYQNDEAFEKYAHIVDKSRHAMGNSNNAYNENGSPTHGATQQELNGFEDFLNSYNGTAFGSDEFVVRNAYPGWFDPNTQTYTGKYDISPSIDNQPADGQNDSMRGPNMGCPAPVLPTTNTRADIESHMDTLVPFGWTNSAIGAVWGERLISPQAPYESEIADENPQWQKAVVIMTDGVNTVRDIGTHTDTQITAYGHSIEERMGVGIDQPGEMRSEFDNKLLRTCQRMKNRGYLVYTIMFDLNDSNLETAFRACATSPGEPYFHDAGSSADLEEAFEDIAADLVKLHISR